MAKKKFKGLKDNFRKEKAQSGCYRMLVSHLICIKVLNWSHFEALSFLKDQMIGRKSSDNMSQLTEDDEKENGGSDDGMEHQ